MAKINKEEEQQNQSRFDFLLPLEPHELKNMFDEYTDGKSLLNFRGSDGKLHPAEYVYYNRNKAYSFTKEYGWAIYHPDGESEDDLNYKIGKYRIYWKQFEEYARKRFYAQEQNKIEPLLPEGQPEVKLNGFWGE